MSATVPDLAPRSGAETKLRAPRRRPWCEVDVLGEPPVLAADGDLAERLRVSLWDDVTSEYDARFFSAHVRQLDPAPSAEFFAVERLWAADEANHCAGFSRAYDALFDLDARRPELEARRPDFEPLAHLFEDEFQLAVLCAYDELATVRAFRANLPLYDAAGPALGRFVRRVIADEAHHYAMFLHHLRSQHPDRLHEGAEAVARVRATEGTTYAATFVLDHDGDEVWDHSFCDEAAAILTRQLAG